MNISQIKEKLKTVVPRCQTQIQALVFAFVSFLYVDDETVILKFRW